MKFSQSISKDVVYAVWLKSELFRFGQNELSKEDINIILKCNTKDSIQNVRREELLKKRREPILKVLPQSIQWYDVEIETSDMPKLYILPVLDWFLDTERTFRLDNTINSLKPNRGHKLQGQPISIDHYNEMLKKEQYLDNKNDRLIIVTSSPSGLFTIIDGTHRACCFLRNNELVSSKAYLGMSQNIYQYRWSVEFAAINQIISGLSKLVDSGYLW